jgi:F-type H+-transporting ATPase subunit b
MIARIATTFGVDWPHLIAQIISFGIVCFALHRLAYKPILAALEQRRVQIANGLANARAIDAKLAKIEAERVEVLKKAAAEGQMLIEEARQAAARVDAEERQRATAAAELILHNARDAIIRERAQMFADVRHDIGGLVVRTTAAVTGKILTTEDHRRLAEETERQLSH